MGGGLIGCTYIMHCLQVNSKDFQNMGHTIVAIVCIVGLHLITCHDVPAGGSTSTRLVGFVGIGYDLLRGNPEGDFDKGGIDPGYRLARNILKRTYTKHKGARFNGEYIDIPDQMEYHPVSSCSSVESVSVYTGAESYQKKLDVNLETSGQQLRLKINSFINSLSHILF